jgi:hypothetical protein
MGQAPCVGALQNRSCEYGASRQYAPVAQSASDLHGEQSLPSPLQTPARGVQYVVALLPQCCAWVASQSASDPHSGAQRPVLAAAVAKSQCCAKLCWLSGQSSSRVHVCAALPGKQSFHRGAHVASSLQFPEFAQRGVQKELPWLSTMQCCGCPSGVGQQSWSSWHGAQYSRGKHTGRGFALKFGVGVAAFGVALTVAHHHPPGQSLSCVQPNTVQKAFASLGAVA